MTLTFKQLNKRILSLAVPNILSNITVPLLGIVDLALAGHLNDVSDIGGIALGTTIFNLIYWNFGFLRMGTTGMTAQAHGAEDRNRMGRLLIQSLLISLIIGLVIILLKSPLLSLATALLDPSTTELLSRTELYYGIVISAAPAVMMTYALNGWIIGMQNTWWPMIVSILTNIFNITISATLVLAYGMGIEGIAIGTLSSQWLGVLLLALGAYRIYIRRHAIILPKRLKELTSEIGAFFNTNIFIFLRTFLLVCVTLYFTRIGAQDSPTTLAVNALLLQFFTIFSYFTDGFAYAAEALSGHFYGRRDERSLHQAIRYLLIWGLGLATVASVCYLLGARYFLTLLTDQTEVIATAKHYLIWVYLIPIAGFIAFIWDGIYIGLTATRAMFITMLAAAFIFFATQLFTPQIQSTITSIIGKPVESNHFLWFSFICYLATRGGIQAILAKRLKGIGRPLPSQYDYYLSIGSTNTTERHQKEIEQIITENFKGIILSNFYITPDVTGQSDKNYLNTVGFLRSELTSEQLYSKAKQIEHSTGRSKESKEIPLDIDIVIQDQTILRTEDYHRDYFQNGYQQLRSSEKE